MHPFVYKTYAFYHLETQLADPRKTLVARSKSHLNGHSYALVYRLELACYRQCVPTRVRGWHGDVLFRDEVSELAVALKAEEVVLESPLAVGERLLAAQTECQVECSVRFLLRLL